MKINISKKIIIDYALQFISAFLACFLTFYVWNYVNMNNYLVCQCFILIASLTFPKHDDIFFGSALSGLTSKKYIPNAQFLFLVVVFDFLIFILIKKLFVGFGGKYGLIAFGSNITVCCIIWLCQNYTYPLYDFNYYAILDLFIYIFGPMISGTSSVCSYCFNNFLKFRNKHAAVITSGILFSLLLLLITISPEQDDGKKFGLTYGEIFTSFGQIGVLSALTKEEFLKHFNIKRKIIQHYFLIGYIAGWISVASYGTFIVGGKVGVVAFISSNFYIRTLRIFKKTFYILINRKKLRKSNTINTIEEKEMKNINIDQINTKVMTSKETEHEGLNKNNINMSTPNIVTSFPESEESKSNSEKVLVNSVRFFSTEAFSNKKIEKKSSSQIENIE